MNIADLKAELNATMLHMAGSVPEPYQLKMDRGDHLYLTRAQPSFTWTKSGRASWGQPIGYVTWRVMPSRLRWLFTLYEPERAGTQGRFHSTAAGAMQALIDHVLAAEVAERLAP